MLILPTTVAKIPSAVLASYAHVAGRATWSAIAGGFSTANVWKATNPDGSAYALKRHDARRMPATQLEQIHSWMNMARAMGCSIVPEVIRNQRGHTVTDESGHCWELLSWLTGEANYHREPSEAKLRATVRALVSLHRVWASVTQALPVAIPCVERRRQALTTWQELCATGWRPSWPKADPIRPWAEAAWNVLPALVEQAQRTLQPWADVRVPVQPCLCDIWNDHVLFNGPMVTGIIDYSAMKFDLPAVDLARVVGSFCPDDLDDLMMVLRTYGDVYSLLHGELVWLLDLTGTVVAATHWLRWLYHERRPIINRPTIAQRLEQIVKRLVQPNFLN